MILLPFKAYLEYFIYVFVYSNLYLNSLPPSRADQLHPATASLRTSTIPTRSTRSYRGWLCTSMDEEEMPAGKLTGIRKLEDGTVTWTRVMDTLDSGHWIASLTMVDEGPAGILRLAP